jgi:hypothetical protein
VATRAFCGGGQGVYAVLLGTGTGVGCIRKRVYREREIAVLLESETGPGTIAELGRARTDNNFGGSDGSSFVVV